MFILRLFVITALAATAAPALNQEASSPASDSIATLRATWAKDLHDKRLDQIVLLYAPDAVFLPPNGQRITGRDAIRELTKAAMDTFTSDLTFQSVSFDSSGELAYDSGEFRETLTNMKDGSVSHSAGNYIMVCKRQPDASWLIVLQAWIASPFSSPESR